MINIFGLKKDSKENKEKGRIIWKGDETKENWELASNLYP